MFLTVGVTACFSWAVGKECLPTPKRTLRTDEITLPSKATNSTLGLLTEAKESTSSQECGLIPSSYFIAMSQPVQRDALKAASWASTAGFLLPVQGGLHRGVT